MKIAIIFMTMLVLISSANAIGFNIPFTEKRFVIFEEKIIGIVDRQPSIPQIQHSSTKYIEVRSSELEELFVGEYVSQYPELAKKYNGKIIQVETDKRIVQGSLRGNYIVETKGLRPDFIVKISSEERMEKLVEQYTETGRIPYMEAVAISTIPYEMQLDLVRYVIR